MNPFAQLTAERINRTRRSGNTGINFTRKRGRFNGIHRRPGRCTRRAARHGAADPAKSRRQ